MHPDSPENSEPAAGPATSGDFVPSVEPVAASSERPQPDDVTPSTPEALRAMIQSSDVPVQSSPEIPTPDDVTPEPEEEEEEPASSTAGPLEFIDESKLDDSLQFDWYILKIQVNREDSIRDALLRRIKMNGVERYFKDVVVPTEDVAEFTKTGKRKVVKKKLYPGYLLINMAVNDESWFAIRETAGIGDFTGSGGKPTPMLPRDVDTILRKSKVITDEATPVKSTIPFKKDDRVRVKEGNFQNFEGEVAAVDQANGRVKVLIPIFGRSTEIEFQHWQIELV